MKYKPTNNGKYPSESTTIITAKNETKPQSLTIYGQRWYCGQFFSKDRMDEILGKDRQQRDNRRHVGDSPNPT